MLLRTPDFWSYGNDNNLAACLLRPAAWLYGMLSRRIFAKRAGNTQKVDIPVICVGNVTIGGAGKTPLALALGQILLAEGKRVHFLTRGYGSKNKNPAPLHVDITKHRAVEVGDEALLLAACSDCWVATDRVAAAQMACAAGAEVIIMDDGLQNPALHKDLSIIVVDGHYGFGNGLLFPAGALRERVEDAVTRSDLVVIVGEDRTNIAAFITENIPVIRADIVPATSLHGLYKKPVIAFAGIGMPQKFFSMLQAAGCDLRATRSFPDHHNFRNGDINKLIKLAESHAATLVTTEKDMVRIAPEFHRNIKVIPVKMQIRDTNTVRALLKRIIAKSSCNHRKAGCG